MPRSKKRARIGCPWLGSLSEVRTKEKVAMKPHYFIFPALFLAVLCLGNASTALAQSVNGAGSIDIGTLHYDFAVSARGGHDSAAGIFQVRTGTLIAFSEVFSLCVVDTIAIGVGLITRSSLPGCELGELLVFVVQDNGNTGDKIVQGYCDPTPVLCEA